MFDWYIFGVQSYLLKAGGPGCLGSQVPLSTLGIYRHVGHVFGGGKYVDLVSALWFQTFLCSRSNLTNVFQMGWLIHVTTDGVWGFFLLVNSFSHQPFATSLFWRVVWSYMSTTKPVLFCIFQWMNKMEQYESSMNLDQAVGIRSPSENGNGNMEPKYLVFWRWLHTPIIIWLLVIGSLGKYMYPWVYNELKGGFIHNTPDGKSINHINQQVSPLWMLNILVNQIMNSFQFKGCCSIRTYMSALHEMSVQEYSHKSVGLVYYCLLG